MSDLPFSATDTSEAERRGALRGRASIAIVVSCLTLLHGDPVDAQPAPRAPRISDQLALARVCASEVGLSGSPEECAAIHEVLSQLADRWEASVAWAARTYSNRVFSPDRRDPRAWVAGLRPDGRRPANWPQRVHVRRDGVERVVQHAPWAAFRDRWLGLYETAGRIVRREIRSQCREQPHHWGMRHGVDLERAQRAGWREIDCGETRNAFWLVPGRERPPVVAQSEALGG